MLKDRYLRGETPEEMFARVAGAVASVEEDSDRASWFKLYYNLMAQNLFLPNSPTLMNAGRTLGQLAACFVIPVEDSMEGIFQAIKEMALVQRTGGGTGFSFSRLRPAGAEVSSTNGASSGPISFMKAFDACTGTIKQGGARRGANMGIMRIDHPDIEEFITCKQDLTQLPNFNISVGITEEFMDIVSESRDTGDTQTLNFSLRFNGVEYKKVNALTLFRKIISCMHATGEPGVIFLDTVNRDNPVPSMGDIEATNPCGEQPLLPYEACNLGSINLAAMVQNDHSFNWALLDDVATAATRFLDNVIDINKYPLPQIEEKAKSTRKIGLGVMGWATLLYKLKIPYDSAEALSLAEKIMERIQLTSHRASVMLAHERGSFPLFEKSVWLPSEEERDPNVNYAMRNAATTTIAPTGTLSIVAGVSSGIEPVFSLHYTKHLADGDKLLVLDPAFEAFINEYDDDFAQGIVKTLVEGGSLADTDLEDQYKDVFITASEIDPLDHIRMQAAFQSGTDNAVSKTINCDNSITLAEIEDVIGFAWMHGCKGLTVYRDGSRSSQPMVKAEKKQEKVIPVETVTPKIVMGSSKKARPEELYGITKQVKTGCGTMFVTINKDETGAVYEVFLKAGTGGGCAAFTEGTARLISIALRYGVPVGELIDQMCSVRCDNFRHQAGKNPALKGKSCPDVIGKLISEQLKNEAIPQGKTEVIMYSDQGPYMKFQIDTPDKVPCPECGVALIPAEGCVVCTSCGFSRC